MNHISSGARPAAAEDSRATTTLNALASASQNLPLQAQKVVDVLTDYIHALGRRYHQRIQNYHQFSLKSHEYNALVAGDDLSDFLDSYNYAYNYFPYMDRFTIMLYSPRYIYSEPASSITYIVESLLQDGINAASSLSAIPAHFINASFGYMGYPGEKDFENDGVQTKSVVNTGGVAFCSLPSPGRAYLICWVHLGWSVPTDIDQFKAAMAEHSGQPRVTILANLAFHHPAPSTDDAISLDILHVSMKDGIPVVRHDICGVNVRVQDPPTTVGLCLSDFEED